MGFKIGKKCLDVGLNQMNANLRMKVYHNGAKTPLNVPFLVSAFLLILRIACLSRIIIKGETHNISTSPSQTLHC